MAANLITKVFLIVPFIALAFSPAFPQSGNDDHSGVQQLLRNAPVQSSTRLNTVERRCVDEKLTGQCIQYHNDQWFSLTPDSAAPLFINVYNQRCERQRGAQMVVFTGEVCQPASYNLVTCISTATPEDFYFKLDRPEPNLTYYVVVDGYLGDFCEFTIEASGMARGKPALPGEPVGEGILQLKSNYVELSWSYLERLTEEILEFLVVRSGADGKRFWRLPLAYNTLGKLMPDYSVLDTLEKEGSYTYEVFLTNPLQEQQLYFSNNVVWKQPKDKLKTAVYFPFEVPRRTNLQVSIREPFTGRVLLNRFVENYDMAGVEYDFAELVANGHYFFEVHVQDLTTKRKEIFTQSFPF